MKILAYKGTSIISRLIQWQTRSDYSHVGIELDDGTVVQAWKGGVRHNKSAAAKHKPGTEVDVFNVNYASIYHPRDDIETFLMSQVGKKYDYNAILRFISRRDEPADDKWFCSELVLAAFPFLLERIPSSHTTPRDIVLSPYLEFERTIIV